jgi:hypothetical protein
LAAEEGERRGAAACLEDSGGKWRAQADDSATRKGEG